MSRTARRLFLVWFFIAIFSRPAPAVVLLEEVVHQTYPVDSDVSLSISNTDGSIRIYAADVAEISLTAIKKAYTSERLQAIEIGVKADRHSLAITTTYPTAPSPWSLKDRSGTVEYTLIVPTTTRVTNCDLTNGEILVEGLRGGSAKGHLVNGWFAGHNCFADLDLSIENGRLDVAFDWWENKTFALKAQSVNGTIRALLPSDASIMVDAESDGGRVASVLPLDENQPKKTHTRMAPKMSFSLNDPEGRSLRMHATHGNIRIDKTY